MTEIPKVRYGVPVHQNFTTERYSPGVPRQKGEAISRNIGGVNSGPKPRQLSPVELFGDFVDARLHGREKEFLKSLSLDQFMTLCASLERSKS